MASRIVVMKDGFIQQVDTPQNLYDYPANLFVGSFIGSPQMNFFDTLCTVKDGKVVLELGESKITLPDEKGKALIDGGYEGKTVVMGIRPENIYDALTPSAENVISAPVNVYELLGAEVYLYSEVEGKNLTARVEPGTHAKVGDMMHYGLKTDMIHVFDKETEQVITN